MTSRFDRDVVAVGGGIGAVMQNSFDNMPTGAKLGALILTPVAFYLSWALDIGMASLALWFFVLIVSPLLGSTLALNRLLLEAADKWHWPAWLEFSCIFLMIFYVSKIIVKKENADSSILGLFLLSAVILGVAHYFGFSIYDLESSLFNWLMLFLTGTIAFYMIDTDNSDSLFASYSLSILFMYWYCSIFSHDILTGVQFSLGAEKVIYQIGIYQMNIMGGLLFFSPLILILIYKKMYENSSYQSFSFSSLFTILIMSTATVFWYFYFFGNLGAWLSFIVCSFYIFCLIIQKTVINRKNNL